ncbi:MAG: hypothetical protein WCB95_11340, partial [Aeromicrobium sp.]
MFTALARLATTRPGRTLAITVVFFVLAGVVGGPVAGLLNSDDDSFSDTSAESALALDRIERASGLEAAPALLALIDTDDTAALEETTRILGDESGVGRVVGGPEAGEQFLSADGTRTYLAVIYHAEADADATT